MSENLGSALSNVISGIIQRNQENLKINDGDFVGDDGLLHCAKCGKPKQFAAEIPCTGCENGNDGGKLLIWTPCLCEDIELKRQEADEKKRKDIERIAELRKISLLDKKYESATFDNFIINPFNERNLKLCRRYAERFDEMKSKNQGLLMWGNVGTGKSYAAACIANHLLNEKIPCIMTSIVRMLQLIQNNGSEEAVLISRLSHIPLVIFDDFGTERNTDYALEKIYNIIDSRYRSGLPMIVTTNLTFSEMQNEPDIRYSRLYDRIFECCYPMQFTGDSFRKKTAYDKFNDMEKFIEAE